jgi:sugar-specific transcriptional regulator TrmB
MDALIDNLKVLGLNTYEARVYLALLQQHPATGYEVSKASGVPQARAYDTLKALETRQMVVAQGGKPQTYVPMPPDELLDRWERDQKGTLQYLRDSLPKVRDVLIEPVVHLRGADKLFEQAMTLIGQARQSIFLELWSVDAPRLEPALRAAHARGVLLKIVGYDDVTFDFCSVSPHALADTIEQSLGGRWLILATDDSAGLVGMVPRAEPPPAAHDDDASATSNGKAHHTATATATPADDASVPAAAIASLSSSPPSSSITAQAVTTRNPVLVFIIKELVIHDLYLLDVEETCKAPLEQMYGPYLVGLRQKVLGDEMTRLWTH